MKEFELTMRLRNNLIKSRRIALGLSVREAAEQAGVRYPLWLQFEALSLSPRVKDRWRPSATSIAIFFRCLEEDLFPDVVLDITNPVVTREVDGHGIAMAMLAATPAELPALPSESIESAELRAACKVLFATLTDREQLVLGMRIDGAKIEEVAEKIECSGARVYQIEKKALRKLRHPKYRLMLKDVAPDDVRFDIEQQDRRMLDAASTSQMPPRRSGRLATAYLCQLADYARDHGLPTDPDQFWEAVDAAAKQKTPTSRHS